MIFPTFGHEPSSRSKYYLPTLMAALDCLFPSFLGPLGFLP